MSADTAVTLEDSITNAQALHDDADVGRLPGEYEESSKTALLAAIADATAVSEDEDADADEILDAKIALNLAVEQFAASAARLVYFSALHATNNAFSTMENYFERPATVITDNGVNYAIFKITRSASVGAFKVTQDGALVDTIILSSNTGANERIVKFKLDSFDTLITATVQTLATGYDMTHAIRLTFNNVNRGELSAAITAATTLHKNAIVGSLLGEYSEQSKAAYKAAIDAANLINADTGSTQLQIDNGISVLRAATAVFLPNGNYYIDFNVFKNGTTVISTMEGYLKTPALLKISGNSKKLYITEKSNFAIDSLKFNGLTAKVASQDDSSKTRVYYFEVSNLSEQIAGWVRVLVPAQNYVGEHDVQVQLNLSSIVATTDNIEEPNEPDQVDAAVLNEEIAAAEAAYADAVEGSAVGNFKAGSKVILSDAIAAAKAVAAALASQQAIDEAKTILAQALVVFKASKVVESGVTPPNTGLADGQYSINVTVLKDGTNEESVMQGYIVPTAKLVVSGSSKRIHLTLTQDKEITGFKMNGMNVSVESRDTSKNTRVVSFAVSDLSKVMNGWVSILWPEFNYDHDYDIQVKFNESSITKLGSDTVLIPDDVKTDVEEEEQPVVTPVAFKDVQGHWAQASIDKALLLGVVAGYADGSFRPNGEITRSEFAVLISRALKLTESTTTQAFNDDGTIPAWAQAHVASAVSAGFIGGYEDQTFRGKNQITRAELAVIIARAAKLPINEEAAPTFADASDIPVWAQKEVAAAVEAGLIEGKGNNTFDPNGKATRAEALTLIMKLLEEN
ncbi:hypothetical protein BK133_21975 [Paenibacillus sp. FSL H8-0548]|uniref:NEAT domain-containing protein n=1 Tax=Paenibacillus sp. FSL H8-0548 TaxID=1920422 RepID=UPI00096E91BC|nr:NEAT domain-containing protein [Paenibacillus sp. FSL H8-0548]OMF24946.1 hypothetical protein BK133_21975 [Paenibacillus sp. FSL H8-0548]